MSASPTSPVASERDLRVIMNREATLPQKGSEPPAASNANQNTLKKRKNEYDPIQTQKIQTTQKTRGVSPSLPPRDAVRSRRGGGFRALEADV